MTGGNKVTKTAQLTPFAKYYYVHQITQIAIDMACSSPGNVKRIQHF
jgi:hypothetical protein